MIRYAAPHFGEAEMLAVQTAMNAGWVGPGEAAHHFEEALETHLNAKHVVTLDSCTSALTLALNAANVAGKTVIIPAIIFNGVANAVRAAGGLPYMVDVQSHSFVLSSKAVENALKYHHNIGAIIPMCYGGDSIDVCDYQFGYPVIVDAAHAPSFYDPDAFAVCYSYGPIKNLSCGKGGALATESATVMNQVKIRANQGRIAGKPNAYVGAGNFLMPDLNAVIGLGQLSRLDDMEDVRAEICERYDAIFNPAMRRMPTMARNRHLYTITTASKNFHDNMLQKGIEVAKHYTIPEGVAYGCDLEYAEEIARTAWSLPLHPSMSPNDVDCVIEAVKELA